MIKNFRSKGLRLFFTDSDRRGIDSKHADRIQRQLDRLDVAVKPVDLDLPGYDFHRLKGDRKGTFAISASGNWRITFAFANGDASDVNLEDYH